MRKLKSAAEIAAKWKRVSQGRGEDFASGVKDPGVDWATGAAAAHGAWEQAITDAIGRQALQKGIAHATNAKWQRKVVQNGIPRWTQGIATAEEDMANGIAKVRDVIERTLPTLPPRGPRGSPANQERQTRMSNAEAMARKSR